MTADILDFPLIPGAPGTRVVLVCGCGHDLWEVRDNGDLACGACRTVTSRMRAFDPQAAPPPAA